MAAGADKLSAVPPVNVRVPPSSMVRPVAVMVPLSVMAKLPEAFVPAEKTALSPLAQVVPTVSPFTAVVQLEVVVFQAPDGVAPPAPRVALLMSQYLVAPEA